jgi:hypothetical protein
MSGQLHAPAAFPPREIASGIPRIGCVGPREEGLDAVEKRKNLLLLSEIEARFLSCPARRTYVHATFFWPIKENDVFL